MMAPWNSPSPIPPSGLTDLSLRFLRSLAAKFGLRLNPSLRDKTASMGDPWG